MAPRGVMLRDLSGTGTDTGSDSNSNHPELGQPDMYSETYELISVTAVLVLLLVLASAIIYGWYAARQRMTAGHAHTAVGLDSTHTDAESTGVSSSVSSKQSNIVWDEASVMKLNPIEMVSLLSFAIAEFYKWNGKETIIPRDFVVPSCKPWPAALWTFPLGRILKKIPGSNSGVSASKSPMDMSSVIGSSSHAGMSYVGSSSGSSGNNCHSPDGESKCETWYELFYDLIFVAAALQLGLILKYDHRVVGLCKAGGLFLVLRATYDQLTLYQNKFHKDDLTHIAYYTMQSMGAFVIALNIQEDENADGSEHYWDRGRHQGSIAMACVLLRIITVFMYVRQQSLSEFSNASGSEVEYLNRIITHTSISAGIFAISTFCSTEEGDYLFLIVWMIAILIERPLFLLTHILNGNEFPVSQSTQQLGHFISRSAIFFMLILGEAVIQLVQANTDFGVAPLARELLGFMVVFNVGSVYHEQQMREPARHVLYRSPLYSVLWIEIQALFSMCVLFYCVGVKLVFHEFDDAKLLRDEVIMCGFASISLLLMYSMNVMHDGIHANFFAPGAPLGHNIFRFVMSLSISTIPFFMVSTTMTVVFLFIMTSFLVIHDMLIRSTRMYRLSAILTGRGKDPNDPDLLNWKNAMDSTHHFTHSSHNKL
jgi:low temperature requirement protein LtrA